MPLFTPPVVLENPYTVAEGANGQPVTPLMRRAFQWYGPGPVGHTVIRTGGIYATVPHPSTDQIKAADTITGPDGQPIRAVFRGGHVHVVTDAVAAELTAAGYTVS